MAAWFFVQVWVLCLVAFLLGAAVTWLAFVRPLRRRHRADAVGWPELPAWPGDRPVAERPPPSPPPEPEVEPAAGPPTDPALAALDIPGIERRVHAGPGAAATDALDLLGVGPAIPEQSVGPDRAPEIPAQPGPVDASGR